MTDNDSAYNSFAFRDLLLEHRVRRKYTWPYMPRINGKAERFILTNLQEWAYARACETSHQRTQALKPLLLDYKAVRTQSAGSGTKHRGCYT